MLVPVSTAGSQTSADLCRAALSVYHVLFLRLTLMEPDCGMGEAYATGARWLGARAAAAEWVVPETIARPANDVLGSARNCSADDVTDWIATFPRHFLNKIERRLEDTEDPSRPSRRATDRRAISLAGRD